MHIRNGCWLIAQRLAVLINTKIVHGGQVWGSVRTTLPTCQFTARRLATFANVEEQ